MIAVSTSAIPKGSEVDLDRTAQDASGKLARAFNLKGGGTISEGQLDGCKTRFVTMIPEEGELGMFAVFIAAREHLVTVQATLVLPLTGDGRDACLGILRSFRREDAGPADVKQDTPDPD